jgi:hypothetical protein
MEKVAISGWKTYIYEVSDLDVTLGFRFYIWKLNFRFKRIIFA